jgi:hypothetical protein
MSIQTDDLAACIDQAATQDSIGVIDDTLRALRETNTNDANEAAARIEANRDLIESFAHQLFGRGALWMMESLRQ